MHFLRNVVRFIVSAIVLLIVGFIVPQFTIGGFWSALFLALIIAAVGWLIEAIFNTRVTPFGRGIVGFITSAVVIWIAQFFVANVSITLIGAILAALVIGIIDLFIPVSTPFNPTRSRTK